MDEKYAFYAPCLNNINAIAKAYTDKNEQFNAIEAWRHGCII